MSRPLLIAARLLAVGCLLVVGTGLAAAWAQPVVVLTPEESVRRALAHSAAVQGAAAVAAEAEGTYRAARAARWPTLATEASYTRLSDLPDVDVALPGFDSTVTLFPTVLDRYNAELRVEQPLFTGFRRRHQIRAARYLAAAATQEAAQTEVDVALAVRQAYWRLYEARALRDAASAALEQVEAHSQDVRRRVEAGTALASDLLTAQTRRADLRLDLLDAENAVRVAQLTLNRLIGLPFDTPVEPAAEVEVEPLTADVATLAAAAVQTRPNLRALDARVAALDAQVAATRGAWLPEVGLVGRYVYARPNPYYVAEQDRFRGTWEGGVVLRWTLVDGGQRQAETVQAQARRAAAEARRADARDEVAVAVQRQLLEVERARQALDVAAQSIRDAEEAVRLLQQQYAEGVARSLDVLDAEQMLRRAQARRAQARAAYALARAALLHALGEVE